MERFGNLGSKLDAGENRRPEYGPIWLDLRTQTVRLSGTELREHLAPEEYQMLWLLVRAQGNLISENEMLDFMHEDDADDKDLPLSNVVGQKIFRLREKLHRITGGSVDITNVRGRGYYIEFK